MDATIIMILSKLYLTYFLFYVYGKNAFDP